MFCLKLFYLMLVMRIPFERFSVFFISFDCFDQLSIFVLFDRFGRLWANFDRLKAF